ncbi:uncharacterized protein LOC109715535 [Ananas comosus]|uniref:Uncharacterized protein LOC109715535 n=1 Tax=Ananas comosus TaxID=4615 RepID=A0A6P5FSW4_ANACO|nr:uncharacterized protein LOC109715535 [Ananas comosus]
MVTCGWIEQCVCNAKVATLVNGETTNWIKTKRGVRQWDPLSPFLFLLVAECLARLTSEATSNNLFKGIGPSAESTTVLTQFADDTFFFIGARKRYMRNLRLMWYLFEWASGLKINQEKSEFYYLGQSEGKAARLAQLLDCKVGSFPTTYLGFPLSPKPPTKEVWRRVIQKLQHRIDGWQAKLLSRGGTQLGDQANRSFTPRFLLKWPEWCGNTTLQAAFPDVYGRLDSNLTLVRDCFGSNGWNWSRILDDESSIPPGLRLTISELKDRVSRFHIGHRENRIGWRWGSNGIFSVKSAYRMMNDGGTRDGQANLIWRLRILLKIEVFCWLVLKKRTLTLDNLSKKGWFGDKACVLCRVNDESVDHLFTQCIFTKYNMVTGLEDVREGELGEDVLDVWDRWK